MRVLLINPWKGEIFPTPAIGYLQAVIKSLGISVKAIDLPAVYAEKDKYDLVGVTFHSFSVKHAIKIRRHFKKRLICGGHHPSAMPNQMLSIGYDQVVIGEGEKAIIEILNGNISSKIHGEISDIDSIPYPDYTGLGGSWSWGLPVISSRGCPFSCNFCASSFFWNRKYRTRSIENVLSELSERIKSGLKTWMFEDDNFTINKQRTIDICAGISRMGSYSWQCASRAETLDEELCDALKNAGCKTIWLGVESLSQDSLDRCNKKTTVEKMLKGIKIAESFGIETMSQFLIGIPGDTIHNIKETARNIRRSAIKKRGANIVWVLPKTDIYNKAKAKGFSDSIYLRSGAPFYTFEQNINTLKTWKTLL